MTDQNLRYFNTFITQLEGGALNEQLSEAIRECVSEIADACCDRGGTHKSSITLKIDFKMNHKDRFLEVEADFNSKLPKTPRGRGGIFFCDADGNLTRQDPRQLELTDELERKRMKDAEQAGNTARH